MIEIAGRNKKRRNPGLKAPACVGVRPYLPYSRSTGEAALGASSAMFTLL